MYLRRDRTHISPSFWGKAFWDYMFLYSKYSTGNALGHFKTLSFFIPCTKCRTEFKKKLKVDPPDSDSNLLFEWIWNFKNEVNERQRKCLKIIKPDITLSQARAEQRKLSDVLVLQIFIDRLGVTLPTRFPRVPARNRYTQEHVHKKINSLILGILDNPSMSVLLANKRHRA